LIIAAEGRVADAVGGGPLRGLGGLFPQQAKCLPTTILRRKALLANLIRIRIKIGYIEIFFNAKFQMKWAKSIGIPRKLELKKKALEGSDLKMSYRCHENSN